MWLELQIFGFRALWSPYFLLFLIGLGLIYYLVTGPYRDRFGGDNRPTVSQQFSFYVSLVLIYITKGSPVDLLSHMMLLTHMIQMAVYVIFVPILIIKGLPSWIWKKVYEVKIIGNMIQFLTKPIISMLFFNSLFSIYHIPIVFNFSKSTPVAHTLIHFVLFFAAFIMWLPLLNPVKKYDRLKPLLKIGYIFANSVLITPACALIIFASSPLYAAYTSEGAWLTALSLCVPTDVLNGISSTLSGPEMFSPLSTILDQQFGGVIMKVIQEIVYGGVLVSILLNWFKSEETKIDPLPSNKSTIEIH